MRLALALGRTHDELVEQMSWGEYLHWRAFYAREPWGGRRGDLNTAALALFIADIVRSIFGSGGSRFESADLIMPDYWGEREQAAALQRVERIEEYFKQRASRRQGGDEAPAGD